MLHTCTTLITKHNVACPIAGYGDFMVTRSLNIIIQKFIPILGEVSLSDYASRSRHGNLSVFWGFFVFIGMLTGIPYLIVGHFELAVPSMIAAVVGGLNLWYLEQGKNITLSRWCGVICLFPLSAYTIYLSKTVGISLTMLLLYPPIFMLGLGLRFGLACCIILFFGTFIALFAPIPSSVDILQSENSYALINKFRFSVVLFSSIFLSWLMEFLRQHMQEQLINMGRHFEEYALQDPLTGLGNRRSFERQLQQEVARSQREGIELGLCLCDIDFFKKFNDENSHECGDAALKHVAKVAQENLRKGDSLFRWGGEEFVIILPHLHAGEEPIVVERIRKAIEETPFSYEGRPFTVTLSFGVQFYDHSLTGEQNLHIADAQLYEAKNQGRNRVAWEASDKKRTTTFKGLNI